MVGRTITVVLGGGRGSRLSPLTTVRAKPAVPLAGKYRLIDIPISNAINSGLREIFVLTQFNSASLNAHITGTYRFDAFSHGGVEVLAAEQTDASGDWYQGTADAVRQHIHRLIHPGIDHVLILSGDHLYRMDYSQLIDRHEASGADITLSAIPVAREACEGFGVVGVDDAGMCRGFVEKPNASQNIDALRAPDAIRHAWGMGSRPHLASMGVYVFRANTLKELLRDVSMVDFGHDILPAAIHTHRVAAFSFDGYWEDIGTVRSFYEANLMLCGEDPPFRFYDNTAPIYTRPRFLPPSVMRNLHVEQGFIGDGCLLFGAEIVRSVIGLRSRIEPGARIVESVVMGADRYETGAQRDALIAAGATPIGIGAGTSIRRAIIDKDARIGPNCVIHGDPNRPDEHQQGWSVRDGIIIVQKGTTIPAGTTL